MSSTQKISLDPQAAAALADRYDRYAEELEQYVASTQPYMAQLSTQLGPIYAAFIQAKAFETTERALGYERVIAQYRAHAQKLRNHRSGFEMADDDTARAIDAAVQI